MAALEEKAKELIDHFDSLVRRFIFSQQHACEESLRKQEMNVVNILGRKGPLKMNELADWAMLSLSNVSGIIDGLVSRALVRRERSENDRRVVWVELTVEGRKLYQRGLEVRLQMGRAMLNALNKSEQETLVSLFRKITEKINHNIENKETVA